MHKKKKIEHNNTVTIHNKYSSNHVCVLTKKPKKQHTDE